MGSISENVNRDDCDVCQGGDNLSPSSLSRKITIFQMTGHAYVSHNGIMYK